MRLGIVMPVWLFHANTGLLDLTYRAVEHLRTSTPARLYIATTRLHHITPEQFRTELAARTPHPVRVLHEHGVDRCVAAAWNWGVSHALADEADHVLIVANDVLVEPECIDRLLTFGADPANAGVALWSGIDTRDKPTIDPAAVTDGADFSCFMLRAETVRKHGTFDEHFRPAYFEDNDYYARVILGGECCRVVHAARFFHHGSMTRRLDAEAAHHVTYWFGANQERFIAKWGRLPAQGEREIRASYYHHPFGDPAKLLSWW